MYHERSRLCNGLVCIPECIGTLKHLEELNLSTNNIQQLPSSLAKLPALRILEMSGETSLL